MRSRTFRVVTFLFVFSMLATPFAAVNAQDVPAATPIEEVAPTETVVPTEPPAVDSTVAPSTPDDSIGNDEISTPDGSEVSDIPPDRGDVSLESTPDSGLTSRSSLVEAGEYQGENFALAYAEWDGDLQQVSLQVGLYPTPDIHAGDTISIWYPAAAVSITGTSIEPFPGVTVPATVSVDGEYITLTFNQDFNPDTIAGFYVHLQVDVNFDTCTSGVDGPVESAQLVFMYGSQMVQVYVTGDACTLGESPTVRYVQFETASEAVIIQLVVPDAQAASGEVITIDYPDDRLMLDPEPVQIYGADSVNQSLPIPVGTAVASGGVITITFGDLSDDVTFIDGDVIGSISATLYSQSCDPDGGYYMVDTEPLHFYANPGGPFYSPIQGVICNAAPASITGELSPDGTQIFWTIDSGHLINGGYITNGSVFEESLEYDCGTMNVVAESGTVIDANCDPEWSSFDVELQADGPARATITITSNVLASPMTGFYLNCVGATSNTNEFRSMAAKVDGTSGHGGYACAEVFPPDGGDFITNDVSADTVYPGQPLTYVVNVDTSVIFWWTVELNDILPAGFEVSSITCSAEPAALASDTCEVLDDNSVTYGVYRSDFQTQPTEVASLTLTIEGIVTADPGTMLESVACFERNLDVYVPILALIDVFTGGLCASAFTQVEAPPATPTETSIPATPTETATPATPTETVPPATPTETPVSKQTSVRIEMWDGSSIEGAAWSLFAPVASQVITDPYLTGVLDANNSAVFTDLPVGEYRFVVEPEGMDPQEFMITVSDESEVIVLQIAEPMTPATPGASPEASVEPTATAGTNPVTGLPDTGNGLAQSGTSTLLIAIAASMMVLMAVGIRVRSSQK